MNMLPLLSIDLDRISDTHRFDIQPFTPPGLPENLAVSFKKAGILQPPILYGHSEGRFDILAGRKRILAAREVCHLTHCPCFVVPPTTPPLELLGLLLESHRLSTALSPMQMAYFFSIGLQYMALEELAQAFLPQTKGKSNVSILKKYLQLLSLEEEIQGLVHNQFITESMAHDLLKVSPNDRMRVTRLFLDFQLGGGKQNRLFMLCRDICQRDTTSLAIFLDRPEIAELLSHKKMNNPQKIQNLFSLLQQMLTPTYKADEDSFRLQTHQLKLPGYCRVEHSPSFETDEVFLTIRFQDVEQLSNIWPELNTIVQKAQI